MNTKFIYLLVILILVNNVYALDVSTNSQYIDVGSVRSGTAPNWQGLTGKEVIVGIVSTGIDLNHKDFKNPDLTTRILYYWTQDGSAPPPTPGLNYGNECTKLQLDTGTCSYAGTSLMRDPDGQGTHHTGIAAGNGQATNTVSTVGCNTLQYPFGGFCPPYRYVGVAPQADIIIVKAYTTNVLTPGINLRILSDSVDYIFQKAALLNKDAVILLDPDLDSDLIYGSRDNTDPIEEKLNTLTGPGKIIVVPIGDRASSSLHAKKTGPQSAQYDLTFNIPTYPIDTSANKKVNIEGWYDVNDNMQVSIISPNGFVVGPISKGTVSGTSTNDGAIYVSNGNALLPNGQDDPFSRLGNNSEGDNEIAIQIYNQNTVVVLSGTWTIRINPISQEKDVNLWIPYYTFPGGKKPIFVTGLSQDTTLTTPSSASNLISVGSYVAKTTWTSTNGGTYTCAPSSNIISSSSSKGPRLTATDIIRPDLVAPGQCTASSLSTAATRPPTDKVEDGVHVEGYHGTTEAAAHVAGAVALMLQKCPDLTPAEAKDMLKNQLTIADSYTGPVPNNIYGNGKLKLKQFTCVNDQDNDGCVNTQDFNPILACSKNTCKADNSLCDSTCKPVQCASNQKCVSNTQGNKVCTDLPPQKKIALYSPDRFSTVFAAIVLLIAFLIYFTNIERAGKKKKNK